MLSDHTDACAPPQVTQADRDAAFEYYIYTRSLARDDYRAVRWRASLDRGERDDREVVQAFARHRIASARINTVGERRFWLSLREPGCVPERKGPWPLGETAKVLREFIAARPTAYIDYITIDCAGSPQIEHGPEVLQMTDGRSMITGRKHNQRVHIAEDAVRTPASTEASPLADRNAVLEEAAKVAEEKAVRESAPTAEWAEKLAGYTTRPAMFGCRTTEASHEWDGECWSWLPCFEPEDVEEDVWLDSKTRAGLARINGGEGNG